jgi:hypothetical protein
MSAHFELVTEWMEIQDPIVNCDDWVAAECFWRHPYKIIMHFMDSTRGDGQTLRVFCKAYLWLLIREHEIL